MFVPRPSDGRLVRAPLLEVCPVPGGDWGGGVGVSAVRAALMPRHPIINRRTVSTLVSKSVSVSEEALAHINEIDAELRVPQGSLVDSALRQLAACHLATSPICCAATGI